ncbi:F0F1 ATP synthase subunit delta [Nocardioides pacificus]
MTFRGASKGAVATLSEELSSTLSLEQDAAAVGTDLFSLAAVLRSEPGLRRVATDVSIQPGAKSDLVQQIFAGKVHGAALTLLASAVTRRWTSTRDLPDALERLGVVAVVRSASGGASGGATSGDGAARLSDELFAFGQVVKDNPDLRDALSDPSRSAQDKQSLVRGLLEGRALPATVALVEQALAGTYRTIGVALREFQQIAAEVHQETVATIRVARPLSDADRQRLADALSRQYGRDIHLDVVVDPQVIGGIRVEIRDDVIDGTVVSRLDDARRKLAG